MYLVDKLGLGGGVEEAYKARAWTTTITKFKKLSPIWQLEVQHIVMKDSYTELVFNGILAYRANTW